MSYASFGGFPSEKEILGEKKATKLMHNMKESISKLEFEETWQLNPRKRSAEDRLVESDGNLKRVCGKPNCEAELQVSKLKNELETESIKTNLLKEKYEQEIKGYESKFSKYHQQMRFAMAEVDSMKKKLEGKNEEVALEKELRQKQAIDFESKTKEMLEIHNQKWLEKLEQIRMKERRQLKNSESEIESLKSQLHYVQSISEVPNSDFKGDSNGKLKLLQIELDKERLEAESARRALSNANEIIKEARTIRDLQDQLHLYEQSQKKLENKCKDLRKFVENTLILKEKVDSLTTELQLCEEKNSALRQYEVQCNRLTENENQWKTYFHPIFKEYPHIPENIIKESPALAVLQLFKSKQNDVDVMIEKQGKLEAVVKRLQMNISEGSTEAMTMKNKIEKLNNFIEDLTSKLDTSEHRVDSLEKEKKSLYSIISSYDKEACGSNSNTSYGNSAPVLERLAFLEKSLENAEAQLKKEYDNQLSNTLCSPASVSSNRNRLKELEKENTDLTKKNRQMEQQLEQKEIQISLVESRLAKGEFNPMTTKILHLGQNPMANAFQQQHENSKKLIESLKAENKRLQQIIDNFAGPVPSSISTPNAVSLNATTPRPASGVSVPPSTAPHDTVEGLKKLNKRLKEVFRDQIHRYREAVYLLTGFKIDLKNNATGSTAAINGGNSCSELRLRSMYAEREDDDLLFSLNDKGHLQLLETKFCGTLDKNMFTYLNACNSIPGFLSNLTLFLFEKQTFQGTIA